VMLLSFAVNLFDANESNITPRDTLLIGNTTITEAAREEFGQREFWPYAALLALLFLLIEWYVYHQRLRTPTMLRPMLRRRSA